MKKKFKRILASLTKPIQNCNVGRWLAAAVFLCRFRSIRESTLRTVCHSERSEESLFSTTRSFASLRMTQPETQEQIRVCDAGI